MLLKSRNGGFFMQITDFSPSLARVRTISDTAVATAPASASDENITLDNAAEEQQPRRAEYRLGELQKLKLGQLMNKPVISSDGALLPFGGVTFSATGGRIRHLIVKMGGEAELYLPFAASKISAWRVVPESNRPCSPKGTQRLILGKPVYSTAGTYCGKLTDVLIKNGVLSLFYTENGVFSAENLYAAGDALLLKPSEPYPIGQKIPLNTRAETSGGVAVRLSKQVTRSALRFFLREGKLIEFTTSLPLFDRKQQ